MKIALNATIATSQNTGTGNYAINLAIALLKNNTEDSFIIYCQESIADIFEPYKSENCTIVSLKFRSTSRRIYWEQFQLPKDLVKRKVDLLHSMAFTSPIMNKINTVLTVHDLAFKLHPETISLSKKIYYNFIFKHSIKKAKRIVAVSDSVKQEIIKYLNIAPERISTIHEAPVGDFSQAKDSKLKAATSKYGIKKPYILSVGTMEPRKNIPTLINAFQVLVQDKDFKYQLVLTGKKGWLGSELETSELKNNQSIIFTGFVEQEELKALYVGAELFAFPSIYEGFGLPLLEAMSCGTPVMASDIPIHREVCSDAAIYVMPNTVSGWTQALTDFIGTSTQGKIVKKGLKRAGSFSWEKAAKETCQVYKQINI